MAFISLLVLWAKRLFTWVINNPLKAALIVIAVLCLGYVIIGYKSCGRTPKLNEAENLRAKQAIAVGDAKEMREVLAASDAREAAADATVANVEVQTINALKESRDKWSKATPDEMAAELERRANQ